MAGQIRKPIGSVALVVAFLGSGLSVCVPVDTAGADDCVPAPNSPAPQGSHWYYHLDRANQRKCWYLRAPGQPAQQAAPATSAPATPSHSMPAQSRPMVAAESTSARMSLNPGGSAQPSPPIKMLTVRSKPAPVIGATTDALTQLGAQKENTAPLVPGVTAQQTNLSSQTSAQAAGPAPTVPAPWPDAPPAVAPVNVQQPIADARADSVQPQARAQASDGAKSTVRGGEPTNNAGLLVMIFSMLALGLLMAAALFRVGMKIVAARRARPIADHAEANWDDDQRQHDLRDDQDQYRSGDEWQEYPSLISAVNDYGPRVPFRAEDEWPDNARGHRDADQFPAEDERPDNAVGHRDAGQIQARGRGDADHITEEVRKREGTLALLDRALRSPRAA
jgi:hypothetical protein